MQRKIRAACTDFEHTIAQKGRHDIRHPTVESRGAIQSFQNLTAVLIFYVDPIRERVPRNRPERANTIFPSNLFPFGIGSAGIADGNFKNPASALRKLDSELWFYIEGRTLKRNTLQQIRPDHLVAGFHIRKIQIANQVAQKGE